jgi:4-hydroxy-3-methylbut-2-en-1-yl diphosphate reductase
MPEDKFFYVASPRGFCAGVKRAILIVEEALKIFKAPVYVRHEVVHNRHVVDNLKKKGVIFVESTDDVPDDNILIFSAHGVSKKVSDKAKSRNLKIFDATCPLVTKVHMEVLKYSKKNMDIILIGHEGHPEVAGTMGRFDHNSKGRMYLVQNQQDVRNIVVKQPYNIMLVKQTTLSVTDTAKITQELKKKYPSIMMPKKDDICYATQNRQNAVSNIAKLVDTFLIVGSSNSSNSNRLKELATNKGVKSYLIENSSFITDAMINGTRRIGISAGASAPEKLVQDVILFVKRKGFVQNKDLKQTEESVNFSIPAILRKT